uniref:Protein kinase domain-containing protein n=1 Tax=Oryza meridionalis TaxID=40149 RepID=A0A0E0C4C9_9ORYZ
MERSSPRSRFNGHHLLLFPRQRLRSRSYHALSERLGFACLASVGGARASLGEEGAPPAAASTAASCCSVSTAGSSRSLVGLSPPLRGVGSGVRFRFWGKLFGSDASAAAGNRERRMGISRAVVEWRRTRRAWQGRALCSLTHTNARVTTTTHLVASAGEERASYPRLQWRRGRSHRPSQGWRPLPLCGSHKGWDLSLNPQLGSWDPSSVARSRRRRRKSKRGVARIVLLMKSENLYLAFAFSFWEQGRQGMMVSSTQQQQQQLQLQRKGKAVAEKGRAAGSAAAAAAAAEKVVVAVRAATREISKTALMWALTHVVQPGGSILLLVVVPSHSSGRKFWGFPLFAGDCASGNKTMELKHEEKHCVEELQCNIVVMKRSQPKVVRLNLVGSPDKDSKVSCSLPPMLDSSVGKTTDVKEPRTSIRGPAVTPNSSPDLETTFESTEAGTSSVSSSDPGTSPYSASDTNGSMKKEAPATKDRVQHSDINISDSDSETLSPPASFSLQPWMVDILQGSASLRTHGKGPRKARTATADALLENISKLDLLNEISSMRSRSDLNFRGNVRDAVSLARSAPPGPPPLCSICQHKAPVFGKPPRWFTYAELELATGGFSQANFLAEGGFGSVHRGVLPDGQAIAVKQHKLASSQGDVEFCSEVEVLSCAQHRNVVMLIGLCVEDRRRLLVYEYICNGSLDSHLYGRNKETLQWSARQKIAVGAARGLRYLHEECRVGCIIHRDMRPNNILVTHDYEPLVGDFGLARWQPDGDMGVDTRVIGTFGYLAPEYAQSGQITEKADVYSFGVVLVELVTGRKAVDINRPKGQQFLTEWARPFLEECAIDELIDPRLGDRYCENEQNFAYDVILIQGPACLMIIH